MFFNHQSLCFFSNTQPLNIENKQNNSAFSTNTNLNFLNTQTPKADRVVYTKWCNYKFHPLTKMNIINDCRRKYHNLIF